MLKKIRRIFAVIFFVSITMLFLDFTGIFNKVLGWVAKVQLIPALLGVNIIAIVIILLLTLLFGRVYCSTICPLGVFQDGVSHLSSRRRGKKYRFRYARAKSWLRYGFLALFIVTIVAGIGVIVALLDPYAAYGRIVNNFFSPLYYWGNNILSFFAEQVNSYVFYSTEIWFKGWIIFGTSLLTMGMVSYLAWRHGRTYCNTVCPVGSFLGLLSKFSFFRITFDKEKCTQCNICERSCKSSCIDVKSMHIDYSRCVNCFNCIEKCKFDSMSYSPIKFHKKTIDKTLKSGNRLMTRRKALSSLSFLAAGTVLKAQQPVVRGDGGLAEIIDKKIPDRKTPIVPPGALSAQHMNNKCTACQLCVSSCPNNVLRPSNKIDTLMQPEMFFERGYCRPECIECSKVCPTGAIQPITVVDKSSISVGIAFWLKDLCLVNKDEIKCDNCQRHCPTGAITLISRNPDKKDSLKIPFVDKELCIGCGACENLCPARPYSAIYVEGNVRHHVI
ncbi:MAG: 4Fe-4S binding protein [Porphyromonadaceae bacterium]|nr:4Fe-4S binding protein [Porphyromonadaceae bacterium]